MNFCRCGCGKEIGKYSKQGYVLGHHNKGDLNISKRLEVRQKKSETLLGYKMSAETKLKISKSRQGVPTTYTLEKLTKKYPLFCKEEEIRNNPNKKGEIQVHCKNHNCENSKEKGGWFTPNLSQVVERIRSLEKPRGFEQCYFYCSEQCKQECPLYNLHTDPYKEQIIKPYTQEEYETFRDFVLERDKYICQFCGEEASEVHHERPQKLEPFFSLDPDYAWSCCKLCHYKFGHKDKCSTGKLSSVIC